MIYDRLKIEHRKSIILAFVREVRPTKQPRHKWWLVMVANNQRQMEERFAELHEKKRLKLC